MHFLVTLHGCVRQMTDRFTTFSWFSSKVVKNLCVFYSKRDNEMHVYTWFSIDFQKNEPNKTILSGKLDNLPTSAFFDKMASFFMFCFGGGPGKDWVFMKSLICWHHIAFERFWQDRSARKNGAQLYGPRVSNFLSHRITLVNSLTFRIYGKLKFQCIRNGPQNPPFCPGSIQDTFIICSSISHHQISKTNRTYPLCVVMNPGPYLLSRKVSGRWGPKAAQWGPKKGTKEREP